MEMYVILYGDGFETYQVFNGVFDTRAEAEAKAAELQKDHGPYGDFYVVECLLNSVF